MLDALEVDYDKEGTQQRLVHLRLLSKLMHNQPLQLQVGCRMQAMALHVGLRFHASTGTASCLSFQRCKMSDAHLRSMTVTIPGLLPDHFL